MAKAVSCLLVLVLAWSVATLTPPSEVAVLKALYASAGGAKWTNTWDLSTDPCGSKWWGILCNAQSEVYALNLPENNLEGTLPETIGDLPALQFFYLSHNAVSGSIPASIGNLNQLQQLGFDENMFNESIPDSFSGLYNLQRLYLQSNQLTGSLEPLYNLTQLEYLFTSYNKFDGTIPAAIGDFYLLQQVGFDENALTGTIPAGFGVKQNLLQAFYVQNNMLTGDFPSVLCNVPSGSCYAMNNNFTCPTPNCCGLPQC